MDRKEFFRLTGMGTSAVLFGSSLPLALSSCGTMDHMNMMESVPVLVKEGDFTTALSIPQATNGSAALTAQRTTQAIIAGQATNVLGYQAGSMLGPTIVANRNETVAIQFQNSLTEPTNIHWHGLKIPANMDGHPDDVVNAGGARSYNFTISQRAGMYWYHPHPHGKTAKQTFLGLAGAFIVRDEEEQSLGLPSGEFEVPLVIQDKRITSKHNLDYSPNSGEIMSGYMGAHITVNGVYAPIQNVKTRMYRFRVLNGSNGRIYHLAMSDGASFAVIGADGGLLTTPQMVTSLLLGPGERADLIIDFSTSSVGSEVYLINKTFSAGVAQGVQEFKIMKWRVTQSEAETFALPGALSVVQPIAASTAIRSRNFDISNAGMMGGGGHGGMTMDGMHRINNKIYDKNRIDETVDVGTTEIWVFDNSLGDEPHPMHIHALQFQILDRVGGRNRLIATESGWKDTVMVLPREKVRVIMTFGPHKGKFVAHCHNLEHEDDGMMLQFDIV